MPVSKQMMEPIHHKMRILISAYACEPGKGSEPGVGWNVVRELSSKASLRVITRANNRKPIMESGESWVADVEWIFWDPPRWLTFWKSGGRGIQLFYLIWQWGIKRVAERSLALEDADVIHHLTFGKYWIPSRLADLGRPFVFGPVGGGEYSPPNLSNYKSLKGTISEITKSIATWFVAHFPPTARLLRLAAWTFCATKQTEEALRKIGLTRLSVLPQSGIRPSDMSNHGPAAPPTDTLPSELVLISGARLIHWKAVDLAIQAVALASKHIPVRLIILQSGPEMAKLKALTKSLKIENIVEFKGRLASLEDVYREIAKADALIHTALHEAFGQVCLESLALEKPVICLDWAGPGLIVDETCGILVPPGSRDETIRRLSDAIIEMNRALSNGEFSGPACASHAYDRFSWRKLAGEFENCYRKLVKSS